LFFRKAVTPRFDQVNPHGQVTDATLLKQDRLRFGLCTILDRSPESSMGGIPTVLIRALGGNALHIGIYSTCQGFLHFAQFVGPLILQRTRSNQRAMILSMYLGAVLAGLIVLTVLSPCLGSVTPGILWMYLFLAGGFAAAAGIQLNLENSWIGDLVPPDRLGWFNSYKWILTCFAILLCGVLFGKAADWSPTLTCYAGVYAMFGLSFLWAAYVYRGITDRAPKNVTFLTSGNREISRMRYTHFPMWCYIVFFWCWSGSRVAFVAFVPLYLIDQFKFSMTNIAWLYNVQFIVTILLLHFVGKIGDRFGHRIPLMVISGAVALCMSLWVWSAWWGIVPIILYQVINGAAGNTHSMVVANFALEILPYKGRAAYLAFSSLCIGAVILVTPTLGGIFLRASKDVHIQLWGAQLNNYHLFFAICTLVAMCCVVPLQILGRFLAKEQVQRAGTAGMTPTLEAPAPTEGTSSSAPREPGD
jgi:MFS family permease